MTDPDRERADSDLAWRRWLWSMPADERRESVANARAVVCCETSAAGRAECLADSWAILRANAKGRLVRVFQPGDAA